MEEEGRHEWNYVLGVWMALERCLGGEGGMDREIDDGMGWVLEGGEFRVWLCAFI